MTEWSTSAEFPLLNQLPLSDEELTLCLGKDSSIASGAVQRQFSGFAFGSMVGNVSATFARVTPKALEAELALLQREVRCGALNRRSRTCASCSVTEVDTGPSNSLTEAAATIFTDTKPTSPER